MPGQPERIGKYAVSRSLGTGAMGTVYEGFDPVIERRVAIKTILREHLDAAQAQDAVARFKREAQAGGRLNHPCIVGVYEYGEDEAGAFIVMEYVEGKELRDFFRMGNRFDLIDVFEIMKQLLAALDYSHRQGVVHRDIKPANLMILPGMKLKVMDFGIARITASNLTQVGTVVGTPTHMSPEQLMGLPADGRADIWSAGVILYELLTGRSPFMADTPATVMHKVLQWQPDPPCLLQPSLPPAFDAVVARALGKSPEERFATAREFHAALLQAFQGKAIAAPRTASEAGRAPDPARGAVATGTGAATFTLPPERIAEVELSLSTYIGPLARLLVKNAQGKSASADEFVDSLAGNIEDEDDKARFLARMKAIRRVESTVPPAPASGVDRALSTTASGVKIPFSPELLASAEKKLAGYVGPLARVLIKDAAGKSGNLKDLYAQLASHIDDEQERKAFLASIQKTSR